MARSTASRGVVENRRISGGRVVQRHVLYLGEINSTQELAWRRSIEVMEAGLAQPCTLSLFPEDRCDGLLSDASIVRLKLSQVRLRRPRQWCACWAALELWCGLDLDRFWAERLGVSRKGTRWGQVLFVLMAYRLLAPGSEWRLHREWFERSALADLLCEDVDPSTSSGGGKPQAPSLSRSIARTQAGGVRASDRALARPIQRHRDDGVNAFAVATVNTSKENRCPALPRRLGGPFTIVSPATLVERGRCRSRRDRAPFGRQSWRRRLRLPLAEGPG